ncbi:MAG: cytochrome b561 [Paracoccaceae bacterium]|jgi:cytochrome b561
MITRRTALKWLHWVSFFVIVYFYFVEPDENTADPGGALSTHAGMGMVLGVVTALWLTTYLIKGLAGRPGPKLPVWGKKLHPLSHKALQIGVPVVVLSGAIAGLAAPYMVRAFGVVPINFAGGTKFLHELAQDAHEIVFDALIVLIIGHALFHVWRHFWIKDNALRIMVPKRLHKYL